MPQEEETGGNPFDVHHEEEEETGGNPFDVHHEEEETSKNPFDTHYKDDEEEEETGGNPFDTHKEDDDEAPSKNPFDAFLNNNSDDDEVPPPLPPKLKDNVFISLSYTIRLVAYNRTIQSLRCISIPSLFHSLATYTLRSCCQYISILSLLFFF